MLITLLLAMPQALQSSSLQTRKILQVVTRYRERFEREKIPARRMDTDAHFSSKQEMLMHAHYLLDGIETYARMPSKKGKTGRHLGSLQTLLWVAGWYTLGEIMGHNRPD